jgi:anti-anti-sigma factor
MATVPLLNAAIGEAVSRGGPISLDLSGVTFVDSTGIGAIFRSANDLPSGCIVIHGAHDGVGRVMDLMGVDVAANLHVLPCTLGIQPALSPPS